MKHLCVVFHCMTRNYSSCHPTNKVHFISVEDMTDFIENLYRQGYQFKLPKDVTVNDQKVCSITFDDGYFNNSYFLPIAEKYHIPFIIFLNSFNILNNVPFIWDIYEDLKRSKEWNFAHDSYQEHYKKFKTEDYKNLMTDQYRPFTLAELYKLAECPYVYFGVHTHYHQPLIKKTILPYLGDIEENLLFLKNFSNSCLDDFALPCGIYNDKIIDELKNKFKRVYTINGGYNSQEQTVIHRPTLINPQMAGKLEDQIFKSNKFSYKIKKALNQYRLYYQF